MATYHINPAANDLLVTLLNQGPSRWAHLAQEIQDEIDTLLKAKLVALVADGEEIRLTPAGRHWATIKRDYPTPRDLPSVCPDESDYIHFAPESF